MVPTEIIYSQLEYLRKFKIDEKNKIKNDIICNFNSEIYINNLTFSYGDKKILDSLSFKISKICNVCDEDVFTPEAVKRVCEAAVKIAATQSSTKKIRIEKAVQKVGKEFDVDVSVGKSQSVGR